jgi:hypothetical protein
MLHGRVSEQLLVANVKAAMEHKQLMVADSQVMMM